MPYIHPRSDWGARPPRSVTVQNLRAIQEVFIHWPGDNPVSWDRVNTQNEERAAMRAIQNFHMDERMWSDFAYNHAVFLSGRIYRGRGNSHIPAAQGDGYHNTGTIAIVVFAGPADTIPGAVHSSLLSLVRMVNKDAGRQVKVRAHGDVSPTECPGPRLRQMARKLNAENGH